MSRILRILTSDDSTRGLVGGAGRRAAFPAALALLLVTGSPPVCSEPAEEAPDKVVVSASRLGRPAAELAQAVDIIDAAEIQARQPGSLAELLRQVPGVNVIQQGGRGSVTSLVLRGGEPNFTVILIDGVKVNDPTNTRGGSYNLSYLDLAAIERIEIVRGPASALYGSDALAGVVNIITNRGDQATRATVELGGHGRVHASVNLGGGFRGLAFDLTAHGNEHDGDIEGASYSDRGLSGQLRLPLGSGGEAGMLWRLQDAESTSFPEDSGGPELAVIRDVDQRGVEEAHGRTWLRWPVGRGWSALASLSRYHREESSRFPGIAPGVFAGVPALDTDTVFVRDRFVVSLVGDLAETFSLAIGGEWQHEDGHSRGTLDLGFPVPTDFRIDRETRSAFAEAEWRLHPVIVQASLRRDDPDAIDAETSARLGMLYQLPGRGGKLRLSWGEAFKAPSFFALAHPLVGNPDLVSETATSFELGYELEAGDRLTFSTSAFRNEFTNLIDFDPEGFTNVNRSRVVTRGVEMSGRIALSQALDVEAHLTYMDTDIHDSDARLRGRPRWRGGLVANWRMHDAWKLTTSLLALDSVHDASIPTGSVVLDGYRRLDLAVSYRHSASLRFGLAVDNALDERYFEAVGFPAAGIRARVSARYGF